MNLIQGKVYECDMSFGEGKEWRKMRYMGIYGQVCGWPIHLILHEFRTDDGYQFRARADVLYKYVREIKP